MREFEKQTYKISTEISDEEIEKRENTVTDFELQTLAYLQRLHSAPNITAFPPYCFFRYKG